MLTASRTAPWPGSAGTRPATARRASGPTRRRRPAAGCRKEVQPDRGADDLGQVGGHRDQLGLQPQAPPHRGAAAFAAYLGQRLPGDDPDLRGEELDGHGQQAGEQHHPGESVAEGRAGTDVDGEVPRIHVGDGGDEGRAEHGGYGAGPGARRGAWCQKARHRRGGQPRRCAPCGPDRPGKTSPDLRPPWLGQGASRPTPAKSREGILPGRPGSHVIGQALVCSWPLTPLG
jgi:hypothetical protein